MGAFTRLTQKMMRPSLFRRLKGRLTLMRRLLFPVPVSAPDWGLWDLEGGGEHIPVLWSRTLSSENGIPLVFSVGFGASVRDYEPLAAVLQKRGQLYRVGHSGFGRFSALGALLRWAQERFVSRCTGVEAARRVRAMIHAEDCRAMRLLQLELAVAAVLSRSKGGEGEGKRRRLSLAGHSYGTDTVLQFALEYGEKLDIETLYLFSPHPPGYLIPKEDYARLKVGRVVLVTGTRDWTRDGVGPDQRLEVLECLRVPVQRIVLDGVGHMDAAFSGLGPKGWTRALEEALLDDRRAE